MSEAKIQFKVGTIEFSGEGDTEWLGAQLDKIIEKAPALARIAPGQTDPAPPASHSPALGDAAIAQQPLASFLRDKNATKSQLIKFLATAVWLHAKGKNRLSTVDVTKALKDANQTRLGNPSDCLNKNTTKGYCEKDGKEFFVTDEGKKSL